MKTKKVLKITPVLVTLNLLVLFAIVGFYGFRFIKYYKLEHSKKNNGTVLLVDEVKKKRSFLDETKGLVLNEEDGTYRYKGEVDDNYIYYSGMYYRILGIDADGNIKAISEDNVTLMYAGFDKGYKDSYVNKWMNSSDEKYSGVYEEVLMNSAALLVESSYCTDSVSDVENITCDDVIEDYKVTLLSLYDYKEAGGKASFINNGSMFNLGTLNDENFSYYVTEDGDIALQQKQDRAILVRPVITISATAELLSGNGSYKKPYIIEKHEIETLDDVYVGSYLQIGEDLYKVVRITNDKVLVVKSEVLMKDEENTLKSGFGGRTSAYDATKGIGKYLNKTYLAALEVKDDTVKGEFYIGLLTLNSYDYTLLRKTAVKARVGMLTMGDMFVNEVYDVLTILRGIEADDIIYVIKNNGYFFGDTLKGKYNIRPAVYLKPDIEIESGKGLEDDPFILKSKVEEVVNNQ